MKIMRKIVFVIFKHTIMTLDFLVGKLWRKVIRPHQASLTEKIRIVRALCHFWRFDTLGRSAGLGRRVRFFGRLKIYLGERSAIFNESSLLGSGTLIIGNNSTIGERCFIATHEQITIGDNVMVAAECYLIDSDHVFEDIEIPIKAQGIITSPIEIGDDVWIGAHVIILKGTRIGAGAVIGANSVIKGDVPPLAVMAGNPAKVIRFRGTE
jgi:acetyltransferase-like isoleucine patch superfamily enzyme